MTHAELLQLRADIDSFLERWQASVERHNAITAQYLEAQQEALQCRRMQTDMIRYLTQDIVPRINQAIAQSDDSNSADWWKQ